MPRSAYTMYGLQNRTFKVSANIGYWRNNHWIKMFNFILIVMNENSEVLVWQLTKGTSIDCVKELLRGLKQRHDEATVCIEGIVVDNCCSLRNKLNSIFGQNIPIKLDIFYAIKRILEQIPQKGASAMLRTVRKEMIKALKLFFSQMKSKQGRKQHLLQLK